jgi:hypothetical protein
LKGGRFFGMSRGEGTYGTKPKMGLLECFQCAGYNGLKRC